MGTAVAAKRAESSSLIRDLWVVTKPRITSMNLITAGGGVWLAAKTFPDHALPWQMGLLAVFLVGTLVSGANALNCWMERESDALMRRTRNRPTATGRLAPMAALSFGLGLSLLSLVLLTWFFQPLAGLLGFIALVSYVWIYTPMKRMTPESLIVGAFPGAAPPLIGWTVVTGRLDAAGLALFAILLVWQLPHFLAIASLCKDDYGRAGYRVHSVVRGEASTRRWAVIWSVVQLVVSLSLVALGVAGWIYGVVAAAAGLLFLREGIRWLRAEEGKGLARRVMLGSVLYLGVIFAALVVDVL